MSISPEIGKIPNICRVFAKVGLIDEIIFDVVRGRTRNLVADAGRLSKEFDKSSLALVWGTENIPMDRGSLMVFNHPNIDTLLPALLRLMIEINTDRQRNPVFVMGSEIPLFGRFNKYPLPGSPTLLKRLHSMYPENIIPVPTASMRKDYVEGRALAARLVIKSLKKGNVVIISPEGHVEVNNQVSPLNTFNSGLGELAVIAARFQIPINPVGIWADEDIVNVSVGESLNIEPGADKIAVVNDLMGHVANLLPNELRGPYKVLSYYA